MLKNRIKEYKIVQNLFAIVIGVMSISPSLIELIFSYFTDKIAVFNIFAIFCSIVLGVLVSKSFDRASLMEIILGFLLITVIGYYIVATRELNNPFFNFYSFRGNQLLQLRYFPNLIISILTIIACRKFFYHKIKIVPQISTALFNSIMLACIMMEYSGIRSSMNEIAESKLISILAIYGIFVFISYTFIIGYRDLLVNKPSVQLIYSVALLFAIFFNGTIQYGIKDEAILLEKYIFPGATLYQILVLFLFFTLIYFIFNRFLIPSFIIVIIGSTISVVNFLKEQMRSEPLLITDFVWVTEVKFLVSFLNFRVLLTAITAIVCIMALYSLLRKWILPGKLLKNLQYRVGLAIIPLLFFSGISYVFSNEHNSQIVNGIPVVSTLNNWANITWLGFSTNARYKSLMYVWTKQLTKKVMDEPAGYSKEAIAEIAKKYENVAKNMNLERTNQISDQTVIYVLNESFSDPTKLPRLSISEDPIPEIRKIQQEYTSGQMHSDHYGGGTANMEIQTLTSLPYYNYSPSVSVINLEVVPLLHYLPSISDSFDPTMRYVLHPLNAENYQRDKVYTELNFKHQVFQTGTAEKFDNIAYVGNNIGDKTVYNNALERISTTQSQFFSVITMQGHLPWGLIDSSITAEGEGFTESQNNDLLAYTRLLSNTDTATREFLDSLQKIEKKITVVFYGDHLPGLYPSEVFLDNPDSQFRTEYFIWSNFETPKLNYPLVNSSDFSALLFKQTNSKVSPYYALMTEYLDTNSGQKYENTKEGEQISLDLQMVQYDLSLGDGYILNENFFETP
ncbi:TPA: LTA synthase family protein [Streptococcus suis]|nr:LTA synthase family protein [Streptococcus suis]